MAHLGKIGTDGGRGECGQRRGGAGGGGAEDQRGEGGEDGLALGRAKGDKADGGRDQLRGQGLQEQGQDFLGRKVEAARGMGDGKGIGQGGWGWPVVAATVWPKAAPWSRISVARSAEPAKA